MSRRFEVRGSVWIITGASDGIGAALVTDVVRRGGHVAAAARRSDRLDQLARSLVNESWGRVFPIPCDVTDREACRKMVEAAHREFGRLDVVVVNAGRTSSAAFVDLAPSVLTEAMGLNFFGAVDVLRPALERLEDGGAVVGVSSICGRRGFPSRTAYCASKFALEGFLQSLRLELRARRISVTVISPGWIDTRLHERGWAADGGEIGPGPREVIGRPMGPERCAQHIIEATVRRRRQVILTIPARIVAMVDRLMPSLVDRVLARRFEQGRI